MLKFDAAEMFMFSTNLTVADSMLLFSERIDDCSTALAVLVLQRSSLRRTSIIPVVLSYCLNRVQICQ